MYTSGFTQRITKIEAGVTKFKVGVFVNVKKRWLSLVGIAGIIASVLAGLLSFTSNFGDFRVPFIVTGVILSFIVVGLGEILFHLKGGFKDNDAE